MTQPTYSLVDDGRALQCHHCGLISYCREDVANRYCGHCKVWHEGAPAENPLCYWCKEPILSGEHQAPHNLPAHWECGLRSVIGGLNHLNGQCSCCGGDLPPDPEGVSRREAARMAAQAWLARNPL